MGFERVKDSEQPNAERGFENADIDLESDELSKLKTVRASRKRHSRSAVEVKTGMKRDRMGRRGYNNEDSENAEGADLIAPDRPIRIASGSRQSQAQYNTKPFKSENSEFGDLFDSDERQEYRGDSSRFSRLDGLAYDEKQDGDGERFAHIFGEESAAPMVHRGENMVQELMRERQKEDEEQRQIQGISRSGGFGLAEERQKEKEKSRFSRRDKKNKNSKPEKQGREANKMDKEREQIIIQPNAEPYNEEQELAAYPAQMPPYGYPQYPQQPYGYPQYPQQPYGYPQYPQQPYGYPQYPQQPYGYPQYPQQPYGYAPYPQQPYGYPQYPQPPYGYPPYPQQPYGYSPMQEQGMQPPQRMPQPERPRENRPAEIMPPERPIPVVVPEKREEAKPVEQPAPQPIAAEHVKEAEPEQNTGSRFNRRSKNADAPEAEPTTRPEEKKAEEIPLEEPPVMPSKFTKRSKDKKSAQSEPISTPEPAAAAEPETPRFERRNRNAPMDAEALSMPSGSSSSFGADDGDDMPMPVSRFKRRNRGGAPD